MVQISQSLGVMMVTLMKDVKRYIREGGGGMVWFWLLGLSAFDYFSSAT